MTVLASSILMALAVTLCGVWGVYEGIVLYEEDQRISTRRKSFWTMFAAVTAGAAGGLMATRAPGLLLGGVMTLVMFLGMGGFAWYKGHQNGLGFRKTVERMLTQ